MFTEEEMMRGGEEMALRSGDCQSVCQGRFARISGSGSGSDKICSFPNSKTHFGITQ